MSTEQCYFTSKFLNLKVTLNLELSMVYVVSYILAYNLKVTLNLDNQRH